ncbi:MAG: VWA domain-containing protein [Cyanobacteriota bacterium]|nr:VWA domain-containing protein [Cyanobacteriota bacterium]
MKLNLQAQLSDERLPAQSVPLQRQLRLSLRAEADSLGRSAPLNLCLVLDQSGSMKGQPLDTVKAAALSLLSELAPTDRLTVVAFDHQAKVIIPCQAPGEEGQLARQIEALRAAGGTAIDEGIKLGIQEAAPGRQERVSQMLVLTDGENEHGDNERCLKLAQVAADYGITIHTLGFGAHWNQDVLEAIADGAQGSLNYIEQPKDALGVFHQLLRRAQSVGLTNAQLLLKLSQSARLAELKPAAQVEPETADLTLQEDGAGEYRLKLGDIMTEAPRTLLINLYIDPLPPGRRQIGEVQVIYDDPSLGAAGATSATVPLTVEVIADRDYQPQIQPEVQTAILTLAKYRQTQIAETKLKQGDRAGAATLLQTAAKTALQLGDQTGATVLQNNATRLQSGEDLSEADRKKTRIVSKTTLQSAD